VAYSRWLIDRRKRPWRAARPTSCSRRPWRKANNRGRRRARRGRVVGRGSGKAGRRFSAFPRPAFRNRGAATPFRVRPLLLPRFWMTAPRYFALFGFMRQGNYPGLRKPARTASSSRLGLSWLPMVLKAVALPPAGTRLGDQAGLDRVRGPTPVNDDRDRRGCAFFGRLWPKTKPAVGRDSHRPLRPRRSAANAGSRS